MRHLTGTPGADYLTGRGIPPALAHKAGVRFLADWFGRPAVVFPMRDRAGNLRGAHGRHTDGRSDPKSRTYPAGHCAAFYTADSLQSPILAITEAPIDALSLAAGGLPAVMATCGTSWPSWLPQLCAFRRVLLATDADPAGDEAAEKMAAALQPLGARCDRLRPAGAKDWNELLQQHGVDALHAALLPILEEIEGKRGEPAPGTRGGEYCSCGREAWRHTPEGTPYCREHDPAGIAPLPTRCPVCLSTGHTTPGKLCDVPAVLSCSGYPPVGSVAPLPAPAGIEYEPGADWQPGEEAPGDTK